MRVFPFLRKKSGVSTIEYIVLLLAVSISTPILIGQLMPFIQDRACVADTALNGDDCLDLLVGDRLETTYKGIPISIDLIAGARYVVSQSEAREPDFASYWVSGALAQENPEGEGPGAEDPTTSGPRIPDYTGVIGGGDTGGGTIVDIDGEFRLLDYSQPRFVSLQSSRGFAVGVGATNTDDPQLPAGSVTFDPLNDFSPLRSDESARVQFDFTVQGPGGDTATATATVIVLGFHADDDEVETTSEEQIVIDVLANDHLPGRRDEIEIVSVTQPSRGRVAIDPEGTITFYPGNHFANVPLGEVIRVEFDYTIRGPMGVEDSATVRVDVESANYVPDFVKFDGGEHRYCGLDTKGYVWCWGIGRQSNALGTVHIEPGDTSLNTHSSIYPRRVLAPFGRGQDGYLANVVDIAVFGGTTCAIVQGTVTDAEPRFWDVLETREIVMDTYRDIDIGVGTDAYAQTVRYYEDPFLYSDSGVWCWGNNMLGQIGDGTHAWSDANNHRTRPTRVIGPDGTGNNFLEGVVSIAGGSQHVCAVMRNGTGYCWGSNDGSGSQLGGAALERWRNPYPRPILGPQDARFGINVPRLSGIRKIVAGDSHTCAIANPHVNMIPVFATTYRGGDILFCFGDAVYHKLGNGLFRNSGFSHASRPRPVMQWGFDQTGYPVGVSTRGSWPNPSPGNWPRPEPILSNVVDASAGRKHTCAITRGVYNMRPNAVNYVPGPHVPLLGGRESAQSLLVGNDPFVLPGVPGGTSAGGYTVWCWGGGNEGNLGVPLYRGQKDYEIDYMGPDDNSEKELHNQNCPMGAYHESAHYLRRMSYETEIGPLSCRVGNSSCDSVHCFRHLPSRVFGLPLFDVPTSISASNVSSADGTCISYESGQVWCWGNNRYGQMGQSGTIELDTNTGGPGYFASRFYHAPVRVSGDYDLTQIAFGLWHICGLKAPGPIYCWGRQTPQLPGSLQNSYWTSPRRVLVEGETP